MGSYKLFSATGAPLVNPNTNRKENKAAFSTASATPTSVMFEGDAKVGQLIRAYNKELINKGFGIRRSDLRKKDLIDMRDLLSLPTEKYLAPSAKLTAEEKQFGKENFWYSLIPCFTEGVLQVNDSRYIYWNIQDINVNDAVMTIILHDYMFYESSGWNPGVSGTITMQFHPDEKWFSVKTKDDDYQLFSDIYTMLNYKKLFNYDKEDINTWEEVVIGCAKNIEKSFAEQNTSNVLNLIELFTRYIVKVNYLLYTNKPVTKKNPTKTITKDTVIEAVVDNTPNVSIDNRRIRTVGLITVTSEDIPRLPTEKSIVRYKVATWKTRGFIRTLSDGRKIPVRESIHHRKCLGEQEYTPVTLQLKKDKNNGGNDE